MPASRGPNNRVIAERLARQRCYLTNALNDAEAAGLLAARGYSAAKMAEGLALNDAALTAYGGRDTASGSLTGTQKLLATADHDARSAMSELRNTLRAMYHGQAEHLTTLGVVRARLSGDRDTFLAESGVTLAAVRKAPYAAEATDAGQGPKAVDAAEAAVAALAKISGEEDTATGSRKNATGSRDGAYDVFQEWMDRFRRFARIAFKGHPGVDARLKG